MTFEPSSEFVFLDDFPAGQFGDARIVRVPHGLETKQQLLDTLARGLDLPDYFGWNWDALDECLRDLSWIEHPRRIVLLHEGVPFPDGSDDRAIYLDLLKNAVSSWGPGAPHELIVVFPRECQPDIE